MENVSAAATNLFPMYLSSLRSCTVLRFVPQTRPHQVVTKSQADKDGDYSKLPPLQSSPQQIVMDEARRILQSQRQSDPNHAVLPTLFGCAESSAQIRADTLQRGLEAHHETVRQEIGAGELQVC